MRRKEQFPTDAKLAKVTGLLRLLSHNKAKLSIAQVSEMSNSDVDTLLPQVSAAEQLKLVRVVGDEIILTKLGTELHENKEEAVKEISASLKKFEPFKTAYEMSKKNGMFKTEELAEELTKKKVTFNVDSERNINIINTLLFQWAIYFGVLDYYGVDGRWVEER